MLCNYKSKPLKLSLMLNLWSTFCQTMRYPGLTMHLLLWSIDMVGRVPHQSPTWLDAGCGVRHGCLCVSALFEVFFFFSWIHVDSASIRVESGRIGWIGSYQPATKMAETDQNGQNRSKSALNHAKTAEIGFEWDPNILNLSFLNFIMNICYFFCVFFFVLYSLPSSFFVLWIKAIVMCFLRIF